MARKLGPVPSSTIMGKRRGFTLTEICFVLAVLLIMAALLFPVLGRVREKSKQATCQ
ncbi:type II secretion system protein, partial [bacterium]